MQLLTLVSPGEEEGVSNLPQLIREANNSDLAIDWMLAYYQLTTVLDTLRNEPSEQKNRNMFSGKHKQCT